MDRWINRKMDRLTNRKIEREGWRERVTVEGGKDCKRKKERQEYENIQKNRQT